MSDPHKKPEFSATPQEEKVLRNIAASMRELEWELGWHTHLPPPKDVECLVLEAGSTGVFRCRHMTGGYFIEDGGDWFPSRPIAWKHLP